MEKEFNLSEKERIGYFKESGLRGDFKVILSQDIKEFIKRLKDEKASSNSFDNKEHILYPWRMCKSSMKSQVKDIYNLLLHRLNLKIDKLAGSRLTKEVGEE